MLLKQLPELRALRVDSHIYSGNPAIRSIHYPSGFYGVTRNRKIALNGSNQCGWLYTSAVPQWRYVCQACAD